MEHPAEPWWDKEAPSSWQLAEVKYVASLPGAQEITLAQCNFGCPHQKPTTFLCVCVCAPELGRRVGEMPGKGKCMHPGGHRAALGLDERGAFRTAALKTYPPQLCKLLAECLWEDMAPIAPQGERTHEVPPEAKGFFIPL